MSTDSGPTSTDSEPIEPGQIEPVDRIRRWQDLGGSWRVLSRHHQQVTVSLCRCDGGEEVDRFTSTDARLRSFLGDRQSSED